MKDLLGEIAKKNSLFDEILYIVIGLFLTFLANLILDIKISSIPNYEYFQSTIIVLFLVVVSYFLAKISCELGFILTNLVFFSLCNEKMSKIKKWFERVKGYINDEKYYPKEEELRTRHTLEAIEQFKDSVYLKKIFDETENILCISHSLYGFMLIVLIASFFIPHNLNIKYIILFFIILMINSCVESFRYTKNSRKLIAIYERKEKERKK
jgi:hypothetical protein